MEAEHITEKRRAIGEALRKKRTEKGLSIRQFAEIADLSSSTIFRVESAKYNVSLGLLLQIAEALGMEVEVK